MRRALTLNAYVLASHLQSLSVNEKAMVSACQKKSAWNGLFGRYLAVSPKAADRLDWPTSGRLLP